MINTYLLKSYIVKFDKKQANLAESMGISLSCLNAKINEKNGSVFKQTEIEFIKKRYHLSDTETCRIFFANNVS